MALDLVKVANVLDAVAEHLDAEEHEKTSSAKASRTAVIDKLAERYAVATGNEMPATIRAKLATGDKDVIGLLNGLVEKQAEAVEPMGAASTREDDDKVPTTKKEAAEAADARFLSWIQQ